MEFNKILVKYEKAVDRYIEAENFIFFLYVLKWYELFTIKKKIRKFIETRDYTGENDIKITDIL